MSFFVPVYFFCSLNFLIQIDQNLLIQIDSKCYDLSRIDNDKSTWLEQIKYSI